MHKWTPPYALAGEDWAVVTQIVVPLICEIGPRPGASWSFGGKLNLRLCSAEF